MTEDDTVAPPVPDLNDIPDAPEAGGDGGGWHNDAPRIEIDALYGRSLIIDEIDIRDSQFDESGKKKYLLILFRLIDKSVMGQLDDEPVKVEVGQQATTATGSGRIVDQLLKVQTFPIKGKVERYTTNNQRIIPELQPIS